MGYLNRYLLLLAFNVFNIVAFGGIVSVSIINIVDHQAPTNLIIYYAYTGLLSLALLLSEVRAPRLLNAQARFLFTYTGRGVVLTYFGCIVYTNKLFNIIACIYVVSLGVVYLVVAWTPFVPMQHGLLYNWSRWTHEGAEQFREDREGEPDDEEQAEERNASLLKSARTDDPAYSAHVPALHPGYARHHTSVQSIAWPAPDTANASFVYGLTVAAKRTESTGDAYLDSIVNSSRFAREVMDTNNDEMISVRSPHGLAAEIDYSHDPPAGDVARRSATALAAVTPMYASPPVLRPYTAAAHYHGNASQLPISSPIPYHVFAPNSRESLAENMAQVSRALADGDTPPAAHRFSR
ncbi:hypothetical protein H4S02_008586 [Coemansia sp. RSA 2611]|nr:hypothetical protein H4S01_002769 [Coemansia sp. RSA 2610]KAJ2374302.1 hypothetical protein H4S02_008586 [Coemansia sp. RSA 2611]